MKWMMLVPGAFQLVQSTNLSLKRIVKGSRASFMYSPCIGAHLPLIHRADCCSNIQDRLVTTTGAVQNSEAASIQHSMRITALEAAYVSPSLIRLPRPLCFGFLQPWSLG